MSLLLTHRQTTYWDFLGSAVTSRVHFKDKSEWLIAESEVQDFVIHDEHPLLIDYIEAWSMVYVSRSSFQSAETIESISKSVFLISKGWRSASRYLNDGYAHANLEDGTGQLMYAPNSYIDAACGILDGFNFAYSRLSVHGPKGGRKVLIAGGNWIVAGSFRVEERPIP